MKLRRQIGFQRNKMYSAARCAARDPSLVEYSPVINTLPTSKHLPVYDLHRDLQVWRSRDGAIVSSSYHLIQVCMWSTTEIRP